MYSTHLTDELIDKIGEAIETPAHARAAIGSLGISHGAFYNWMRKGTLMPDSMYGRLRRRVALAECNRELHLTELVYKGATKDAKWAAWLLERLYPERWGAYAMPGHEGDIAEQFDLDAAPDLEGLSGEEIAALAAAAEILDRRESAAAGGGEAGARPAPPDPVHDVHIPELPRQLAPPADRDET